MRFAVVFLGIICVAAVAEADTTWVAGGSVSGDWTIEGSPFMILGTVTIEPGDSLRIFPGVRIFVSGPQSVIAFVSLL